jgi:hypothetical protein
MASRQLKVAKSIVYSILSVDEHGQPRSKPSVLGWLWSLFNLYWLTFLLVRADLFSGLREFWTISDEDYKYSFGTDWKQAKKRKDVLYPLGDMGYSGSTFFRTHDSSYLVKSVPRHFEHTFFKNEMLIPYVDYMRANPGSLLVRITDFLECSHRSIGSLLGLAPSHHIVMENILYGQDKDDVVDYKDDEDSSSSSSAGATDKDARRKPKKGSKKPMWESWDLKPSSYFYPERDVAGGALTSQATKSRLADEFDGKIHLTLDQAEDFKAQLQKDTKLLADCNAVDYSLFLVRVSDDQNRDDAEDGPVSETQPTKTQPVDEQQKQKQPTGETELAPPEPQPGVPIPPLEPPFAPPGPPSWRAGLQSSDGRTVYRAAVLDFFWAKHTLHARFMTGLVKTYNLVDAQGPMSVTTPAAEYRERFLAMCLGYVAVDGHPHWNEPTEPEEPRASSSDSRA